MQVGPTTGGIALMFKKHLNIFTLCHTSCRLVTVLPSAIENEDVFSLEVEQGVLCLGGYKTDWENIKKKKNQRIK